MTNPTNSSQNQHSRKASLELVLKLVEASPFRALLKLPPEEVLDFFHSRVGEALLEGLRELQRRESVNLMRSTLKHIDIVDKLFEVRGIDSVCQLIVDLPQRVKQYLEATKNGLGKDIHQG